MWVIGKRFMRSSDGMIVKIVNLNKQQVIRLIFLAALVVAADALDIISTYLATPDLAMEWNPLVRSYGWGWEAIILLHIVILAIFICGLWHHTKHEPAPSDVPKDIDGFFPTAVWYMVGYHGKDPKVHGNRFLAFIGLAIPLGAAINALCNTVLNLSFYFGYFPGLSESTINIYRAVQLAVVLLGVSAILYWRINKRYVKNNR